MGRLGLCGTVPQWRKAPVEESCSVHSGEKLGWAAPRGIMALSGSAPNFQLLPLIPGNCLAGEERIMGVVQLFILN